jgi:hypothetical protein
MRQQDHFMAPISWLRQAQARSFSDAELAKFGGMSFKEQFTFLGLLAKIGMG